MAECLPGYPVAASKIVPGGRKQAWRATAGIQARASRQGGSREPTGGSLRGILVEIWASVYPQLPCSD